MARATGAVGVAFRRWDAIAAHRTSEAVRRRGEIEQSTRTLHAAWRASQKRALAAAFSRIKLIAKHQSAANDATVAARRADPRGKMYYNSRDDTAHQDRPPSRRRVTVTSPSFGSARSSSGARRATRTAWRAVTGTPSTARGCSRCEEELSSRHDTVVPFVATTRRYDVMKGRKESRERDFSSLSDREDSSHRFVGARGDRVATMVRIEP